MFFEDFKKRIENTFNKKFTDSLCVCDIFKCCGKAIYIDCTLGKDEKEYAHGIKQNDCMHVSFMIFLPDDWKEDQELPEKMLLESQSHNFYIKPFDPCFYCDYKNVPYRKTEGSPEKIIDAFGKFVRKLFESMKSEYLANNLFDRDMELVKNKGYFKEA